MTRFVHITDSHNKYSNIISRTDNYCIATLDKLRWVAKWCNEHKVDKVIHTGDLFDIPSVSDWVAGQVAGIFTKHKLQLYFIMGNHDIIGKKKETYVNGKLGMFEHYPWFHFIGEKVIEFDDCYLSGHDYCKKHEEETHFDMPNYKYDKNKTKILALHQMLTGDKKSVIINGRRCMTSYRDIVTNADMILCGHYHPGMSLKKCILPIEHTVRFSNPGSLARTSITENEIGRGPALTYIRLDKGQVTKFKTVLIPCDRTVFKRIEGKTAYDVKDYASDRFFEALGDFKNVAIVKDDINMIMKPWIGKGKELNLPFEVTQDLVTYTVSKVEEVRRWQTK